MNLILLGVPGSGKGTQAKKLKEKYQIPHISTGDMFRKTVEEKSELALRLKDIMEKGELVPDELVIDVVNNRLKQEDCKKGFMLDGFPRTLTQGRALESILGKGRIDLVLYIELSEKETIKRLSGRRVCSDCKAGYHIIFQPPERKSICDKCGGNLFQRDDDKEDTIMQRLKVYNGETAPLIDYYQKQGILKKINGNVSVDEVFNQLCKVIDDK